MPRKSDEANAIMRSPAKIQRICKMKAKRLHTDGSKEKDSKKLRDFSDKNGTSAAHTAPNASQSKEFAEPKFRQLMDATRT